MLAHEGSQLFRDRERDQKMMTRELALDLSLEPLLSFVVLAGGTVAITTGNKELLRLGTAIASVKSHPASLGATGHDGIDDFAMGPGHCRGIALEILGAKGCKDFTDGGHGRVPPSHG